MLRGYRGIIIAACGCLTVAAASPPQQATSRSQGEAGQRQGGQPDPIATAIEKLANAQRPDQGCKQGRDDRGSDLCAQWKAADAANEAAIWTKRSFFQSLLVGIITLIVAGIALELSRRAWRENKRSADSNRAWISIHPIYAPYGGFAINGVFAKNGVTVQAEIKNVGGTPALEVRTITDSQVVTAGADATPFVWPSGEPGKPVGVVHLNTAHLTIPHPIDDKIIELLRQQEVVIVFSCIVKYRDVHSEEERVTQLSARHTFNTFSKNGGHPVLFTSPIEGGQIAT